MPAEGELDLEQLIREEDMVISITQTGYIKRVAASTYRQQKRGGVGVMGMDTKDDDWIEHLLVASTHDYVLFFTSVGKVYRLKVHELPEGNRQGRGRAVVNLLPLREGERVRTVIATRDFSEGIYLVQATKRGIVKKTLFKEYDTPRKSDGIIAINIREGDELIGVRLTLRRGRRPADVAQGPDRALRRERGARDGPRDRRRDRHEAAQGRRGHRDRRRRRRRPTCSSITENGYGKRTRVAEYPRKGRGTMGVLTIRLVEARGAIVGALVVGPRQEILVITESGTVQRTAVDGISQMGRATQGVIVQRLREGDRISAVAMVDRERRDRRAADGEPLPLDGSPRIAAAAPAPAVAEDEIEDDDDAEPRESMLDLADEAIDGGDEDDDAAADDEDDEASRRRRRAGGGRRRGRGRDRLGRLLQRAQDVDRDRQDRRRVVRRGDLEQRLQVAELERDRARGDAIGGHAELLGGLVLALRADDLRAPLALGLGLPRHRALHRGRQLDVLDLDDGDLDAPGRRVLVDDVLEDLVDLVALGEQLVERVLAEHRAQRRLGDLRRRHEEVLDLRRRPPADRRRGSRSPRSRAPARCPW